MYLENERRSNYPASEKELYGIKNINHFIQKERRQDELDRLREVREQNKTWLWAVIFCLGLNIIFVAIGLYGWVENGFK